MTGPRRHFQTNSESRRTCYLHEVTLSEARRVVAFQIQLMLEQKESSTGWRLRGKGFKLYDKECFDSNCILIDKCFSNAEPVLKQPKRKENNLRCAEGAQSY